MIELHGNYLNLLTILNVQVRFYIDSVSKGSRSVVACCLNKAACCYRHVVSVVKAWSVKYLLRHVVLPTPYY